MRMLLACLFSAVILVSGLFLIPRRSATSPPVQPPRSVVICGIQDHPCVTYAVSYHLSTHTYGDSQGEGVTDARKSISIALRNDRFKNVKALEHEVLPRGSLGERVS